MNNMFFGPRLSLKEQALFAKRLALLVKAGLPTPNPNYDPNGARSGDRGGGKGKGR